MRWVSRLSQTPKLSILSDAVKSCNENDFEIRFSGITEIGKA